MTSFALPTPPPASAAAPQWMRHVLRAAAVYNLLWGGFAVLFPRALFDWLGMVQPNYPQFWQCIGMIVGVYGIGYAIAASDPARHWPIVLVGFLGKVAGPLGMVQALWEGALPWTFALNCLTNDLVWWIPFALILRFAWQAQDSVPSDFPSEAELLAGARTVSGESLAELSTARRCLSYSCGTRAALSVARPSLISPKTCADRGGRHPARSRPHGRSR